MDQDDLVGVEQMMRDDEAYALGAFAECSPARRRGRGLRRP
jgi:hypothetical protein